MIVHILVDQDGNPLMTYSSEELATSQIPLVEKAATKNTGKSVKIVKVVKNKVDLPFNYAGLPDDHF